MKYDPVQRHVKRSGMKSFIRDSDWVITHVVRSLSTELAEAFPAGARELPVLRAHAPQLALHAVL